VLEIGAGFVASSAVACATSRAPRQPFELREVAGYVRDRERKVFRPTKTSLAESASSKSYLAKFRPRFGDSA